MYKISQLLYVIIVILRGKYCIISFFFQIIAINSSCYFNAVFHPCIANKPYRMDTDILY